MTEILTMAVKREDSDTGITLEAKGYIELNIILQNITPEQVLYKLFLSLLSDINKNIE